MGSLKVLLAHVVGSQKYVILDQSLEAVLGIAEGVEEAKELALRIESRNMAFDFDAVYSKYPRKIGKASGMRWLKSNIKSKSRYVKLQQAVENYVDYCDERQIQDSFIQHFSTWVRKFDDWCDENYTPKVEAARQVKKPDRSIEDILSDEQSHLALL